MRKTKDLSVTVVSTDDDRARLGTLLEHLAGQLRELRIATPDEVEQGSGAGSDIIHAFGWHAGLSMSRSSLNVPQLMSPPGLASGDGLPRDDADAAALQGADGVLVTSSRHRDEVHNLGVPWYRLTTIPPSVDTDVYGRRGPSAARTDRFRVTAETRVGTDEVDTLFHAMRLVESAELILFAGVGAESEQLRRQVASGGLSPRTAVVSPAEPAERAWWLRSTDAVVDIPRQPADSSLALQAMACGSAVIATPVDQLEDVVVHGVTGLHVPIGDGGSLARALRTVLADDFTIESLGMAASDRAVNRFSVERVARDLASAYARSACDEAVVEDDVELDDVDAGV
jgi:D-inositol-3-phosphate glycosyltransferase